MFRPLVLAPFALAVAAPAAAELPQPVRAMIEAAIATNDEAKVRTVVELAKATNPADVADIDALNAAFVARKGEEKRLAEAKRLEAIREASVLERWRGRGELGGSRATGNSPSLGLAAGLDIKREGIDWTHSLRGRADYQRTNGIVTREKYFAAYEPRYQIANDLFAYGLGQFERDTIQGYDARYAVSAGLGWQPVKRPDLNLALKAGPAFRRTEFTSGESDSRLAGLLGLDFDWTFADGVKLTQDSNLVAETGGTATVLFDSRSTTLALVTGLEARITGKLSSRFAYQVDYNSDPPAGRVDTDTISRVTLVYGF
jgi:putative salt-induced outer membrane protein